MPVLQHLTLESALLVEGAPFLLGSRNLSTVQTLCIKRDQLIDHGAAALGKSPHPRALREVSFAHTVIATKSVIARVAGDDNRCVASRREVGEVVAVMDPGERRLYAGQISARDHEVPYTSCVKPAAFVLLVRLLGSGL